LAICRSGAASCAELSAFGVPALLVPYPYATHDHQTANARAMERLGAADVVPEEFLTVSWLQDYLGECMRSPRRLERMRAATLQRAHERGAEELANLVEQVGTRTPVRAGG
jgi:UDP-N-acetylglucosamine--N-acetylmuramyl-(pentapeptide) pyrophosphoryl-undecaprenol N-acetylglucosamine transferase